MDRHLAGCADDADPDQNDGPLPLSAFAALDALRHCCPPAAAAADVERLARLARRVHHHDFLLRPSALGLVASLGARCQARHARAREAKRGGRAMGAADQSLGGRRAPNSPSISHGQDQNTSVPGIVTDPNELTPTMAPSVKPSSLVMLAEPTPPGRDPAMAP